MVKADHPYTSLHSVFPTPPGPYGSLDVWVRQWEEAVCNCHASIKVEKGKANYPQNQSNEPTQSDELAFQTKKPVSQTVGFQKAPQTWVKTEQIQISQA